MANNVSAAELTASEAEGHGFNPKVIWKTFWILLVITCVELSMGMFVAPMFPHSTKIWFNIFYIILTAAKAFYIIAEFMHLKHELKNLVMTIALPSLLFIWLIGALLWDGDAFKRARNDMDPYFKEIKKATPAPLHHDTEEHLK